MKKLFLNLKNFILCFALKLKLSILNVKKEDIILCFDCLYDENQECIDAFSLFEQLKNRNIPAKYVALKDTCSKDKLSGLDDVIFVKNRWEFVFKYLNLLKASKAILSSFGLLCGIDSVLKNANKNYIFIEHGVIFYTELVSKIYSKKNFNKILVPSKYTYELYKINGFWNDEDMILSGLPRWDKFLTQQKQNSIFIFFTWRKAFLNNKNLINVYFKNIASFLEVISDKIPAETKIMFAWHHEIYKNGFQLPKLPNRIELIKPQDFALNVSNSSLFITDHSSAFWDYFYQDKPVVFYNPINVKVNNRIDNKIEETFFNFKSRIYNCFDDIDNLIKKVSYYINTGYDLEPEYRNINASFFFEKGNNCEKIIDKIK